MMLSDIVQPPLERLRAGLGRFHRGEGGAVALMMMAAAIVAFLISNVLLDAGTVTRDRIAVQAAADVSVWSQASVEARAMNMLAFANVGKRITFGITSFYEALWLSYAAIGVALGILLVACIALIIPTFGAVTPICKMIGKALIELAELMIKEAPDLGALHANLNRNYFKKDMESFNEYQKYMADMVPWWGFSEALLRGARNGATSVVTWPPPERLASLGPLGSKLQEADLGLPVRQAGNSGSFSKGGASGTSYGGLCAMTLKGFPRLPDVMAHSADYVIKSITHHKSLYKGAFLLIVAVLAPVFQPLGCEIQRSAFGGSVTPFELKTISNRSDWLRATSKLAFAYRKNDSNVAKLSENYQLKSGSSQGSQGFMTSNIGGVWTLARAEMAYQGNNASAPPNLWYSAWTSKMRPVSLPGEWQGQSKAKVHEAYADVILFSAIAQVLGGNLDAQTIGADMLRMGNFALGYKDQPDGIAK